jgi:two-component system response regulator
MAYNKILLVEDNPSDVELTKRALVKAGIANPLVVAKDGREALDYLFATGKFEGKPAENLPALVLLDLKLPIIDGLEVLKCIRENPVTKRLIVVILSTSIEQQDVARAYDLGVNSFIRKPVDFIEFTNAIKLLGNYWLQLNQTLSILN